MDNEEFLITIEYDNFVTRFDLDEIMTSIDRIIEDALLLELEFGPQFFRKYHYLYPYLYRNSPEFSYIGIISIETGSITLGVVISAAISTYVAKRFKKGVDKSLLAAEFEHSGRLTGDFLGKILELINNWAEKYVPKQQELGGNIRKIKMEQKPKPTAKIKNRH